MKGYQIRNRPTMVEQINARPRRRTFDQWVADLTALSGKRDVSQEDAAVQAAFAADPLYADAYAAAECADGKARENNQSEIEE